jgi:histidinol phosphatase-like PHP family hydrolase
MGRAINVPLVYGSDGHCVDQVGIGYDKALDLLNST